MGTYLKEKAYPQLTLSELDITTIIETIDNTGNGKVDKDEVS